jgi:hypothetical protein
MNGYFEERSKGCAHLEGKTQGGTFTSTPRTGDQADQVLTQATQSLPPLKIRGDEGVMTVMDLTPLHSPCFKVERQMVQLFQGRGPMMRQCWYPA